MVDPVCGYCQKPISGGGVSVIEIDGKDVYLHLLKGDKVDCHALMSCHRSLEFTRSTNWRFMSYDKLPSLEAVAG
tara:strand:+ start:7053 stop:7277 length:225 start_codon:yes stop_codon:yes gene_type:complete